MLIYIIYRYAICRQRQLLRHVPSAQHTFPPAMVSIVLDERHTRTKNIHSDNAYRCMETFLVSLHTFYNLSYLPSREDNVFLAST